MPSRTLILVRHGQYHLARDHERYGQLTPIGKRQAKHLAKRLAHYPIDTLHASTAPRAIETATLIGAQLRGVPQRRSALLLEGIPTALKGLSREARRSAPEHRARMERAFARYFRPTRGKDRIEVVVFHGNILRYLMRRAMGDSAHKWSRLEVMHCGISIVDVRGDGATRILALNDVGHLPFSMQTFL